jgi:hypothetical protein
VLQRDIHSIKEQLKALARVNRDKSNIANALFYEEIFDHIVKLETDKLRLKAIINEYRDARLSN